MLPDADTGSGTDAGEFVQAPGFFIGSALVSPAWLTRWGRQRFPKQAQGVFFPSPLTAVSDSDSCLGEDSEIDNPGALDSDACSAADGGEHIAAHLSSAAFTSDAGHGTDAGESLTGTFVISSRDTCAGTDAGYLSSAQFYSADTGHGTDSESTRFGPDAHVTDADAGTADEFAVIDVYSFQPPFRWTGGQYEVHLSPRVPPPLPRRFPPARLDCTVAAAPALAVRLEIEAVT